MTDGMVALASAFFFGPATLWIVFMVVRLIIFVRGCGAEQRRREGQGMLERVD
jgi:hypothetical protein